MTNKDPDLVQAIDATAHKLLRKIGGDSKLDGEKAEIFVEQVKAFDVVVRWAQARKALLPVEEKDNKFAGLKRDFHVGAKSRNRGSSSAAAAESSSIVAFPGADLESSSDGDDAEE